VPIYRYIAWRHGKRNPGRRHIAADAGFPPKVTLLGERQLDEIGQAELLSFENAALIGDIAVKHNALTAE
jgi:hypothetical protein